MNASSKADVYLVLVTLMAAISWMFSREAVALMPPLLFIASRFTLAALLLMALAPNQFRRMSAEQWLRATRVGLVFGVAMSFWVMGLFHASHVGEGAFITSLAVVIVPIMARLFFGERPPLSTWLALPVAAMGLALLSLRGGFRLEAGQLYFIIAATLFALYYNLNTHAANTMQRREKDGRITERERIPALALTAVALLMVGLVAGTVSTVLEDWRVMADAPWLALSGWVLASALIGTAGRFLLQTYAQSLSPNSHGVVIMVVEPVWTALIAAWWLQERMSVTQLAGCSLIFAGLLVSRWRAVRGLLKAALPQRWL